MKKQFTGIVLCSTFAVAGWSLQAKAEEPKEYRSNGLVEFIPNVDPTEPVDPENPDPERQSNQLIRQTQKVPILVPKDRCLLIMLQVLTLGKIVFRIKTKYILQEHSNIRKSKRNTNFVQISDIRGTNSGWSLTVTQKEQFKATKATLNSQLTGAQISLANRPLIVMRKMLRNQRQQIRLPCSRNHR